MSWDQLVSVIAEAREIDRDDETTAPTSCPNDATPLRQGLDGKSFCPWDGLVWPDDAPAWGRFPGSY